MEVVSEVLDGKLGNSITNLIAVDEAISFICRHLIKACQPEEMTSRFIGAMVKR
jgi:hypothetical protein